MKTIWALVLYLYLDGRQVRLETPERYESPEMCMAVVGKLLHRPTDQWRRPAPWVIDASCESVPEQP